jgi:hypothetical protein
MTGGSGLGRKPLALSYRDYDSTVLCSEAQLRILALSTIMFRFQPDNPILSTLIVFVSKTQQKIKSLPPGLGNERNSGFSHSTFSTFWSRRFSYYGHFSVICIFYHARHSKTVARHSKKLSRFLLDWETKGTQGSLTLTFSQTPQLPIHTTHSVPNSIALFIKKWYKCFADLGGMETFGKRNCMQLQQRTVLLTLNRSLEGLCNRLSVCLYGCMSRLYCSTCEIICLQEIKETDRNANWKRKRSELL